MKARILIFTLCLLAANAMAAISTITTNASGKWVGGTSGLRTNWNEMVRMYEAGELGGVSDSEFAATNSNFQAQIDGIEVGDPVNYASVSNNAMGAIQNGTEVEGAVLVSSDIAAAMGVGLNLVGVTDEEGLTYTGTLGTSNYNVLTFGQADDRYLYATGTTNKTLIDAAIAEGGGGVTNVVIGATDVAAEGLEFDLTSALSGYSVDTNDIIAAASTVLNVLHFGAVGDAGHVTADSDSIFGATITNGTTTLIKNAGDAWSASDVGKAIMVRGAGAAGATLKTTIASYTGPDEVELTDAAATTVYRVDAAWGSNDTTAIQSAVNAAANASNGTFTVYFPAGYKFLCNIDLPNVVSLRGGGAETWRYPVATVEVNGSTLLPWDDEAALIDMHVDSPFNTNRVCNNSIENIRLQGYSYTGAAGLDIHNDGTSFAGHGMTLYRCGVNTFSTGIHNEGGIGFAVRDCAIYYNTTNFFQDGEAPSTTFDKNIIAMPDKEGSTCYGFYVTQGVELNIDGLDCGQYMDHIGYFYNCIVNLESFNFEYFTGDWGIFSDNAVVTISTGRLFQNDANSNKDIRFVRSRGSASKVILDNVKILGVNNSLETGKPYFFQTDYIAYWPDFRQSSTSATLEYTLERFTDSTFTDLVEVNTTGWITRDVYIGGRHHRLNRKILEESFIGGGLTSGIIGELGWDTTTGTISKETSSEYGGEIVLTTAATVGSVANIHLSDTNSYPFTDLESADHIPWEITFALRETTNVNDPTSSAYTSKVNVGLMGGISTTNSEPTYFCGLSYNNINSTLWQFRISGPGGSSVVNTVVNGSAGWDTLFRMRCVKAGEIRFRINDDPEEVISTTYFQSQPYTIGAAIEAQDAKVKTLNLDRVIYDAYYNRHDWY